jgi:hypothetical protein
MLSVSQPGQFMQSIIDQLSHTIRVSGESRSPLRIRGGGRALLPHVADHAHHRHPDGGTVLRVAERDPRTKRASAGPEAL